MSSQLVNKRECGANQLWKGLIVWSRRGLVAYRSRSIDDRNALMIIQVTETINDGDCQRLMMLYDQHAHFSAIKDQTGHPVVYWNQFRDAPGADEIVPRLVRACLSYISSASTFVDPLYPETVVIAALPRGGCHSPHADNCRQNEEGDWVPNHTPQRDASAIYYLNDDFEGGEIVFSREKVVV